MLKRIVYALVDASRTLPRALLVVMLSLCGLGAAWWYALSHFELHSDIRELLPRDSPGFKAFEHQLGRVGGGATLIVIAESPDRDANRKFIDDLDVQLEKQMADRKACLAAAGADEGARRACGTELIGYIEAGTKDVRAFFKHNKFLYASLDEVKNADKDISYQIAINTSVEELDKPDEPAPSPAPAGSGASAKPPNPEKKSALGLDEHKAEWDAQEKKHDDFPTGYFETQDGGMVGLRIISQTTGTGDAAGDTLLGRLQRTVSDMKAPQYQPQMVIGFAGDIPNAVAEKESIMSEAALASAVAILLLLLGIVVFFRRPLALAFLSLPVVFLPAFFGVGCAYAFAMWKYGFVNTSGAFLGAIILGNGINYPIVLLSRYREFRARGMEPDVARREAVWNAFRAELVGACVGSIAYGSLTVTRFRGFSQFGTIGFVGMILVWLSMIPLVPAALVIIERFQGFLARVFKWKVAPPVDDYATGPIMRGIAVATAKVPWLFVGLGLVVSVAAASKLPKYLSDPWEYNFDKLGSRGSKHGGAGEWSNKAEKVFGGKMNIAGALTLADSPEQVPLLKAQILENDGKDPEGKLIKEVATVADLLPGTVDEQNAKLKVLKHIRSMLTYDDRPSKVVFSLPADEQQRVIDLTPPKDLHLIEAKDLPALLRRRFEENNGVVGTVFYVKYWDFAHNSDISYSDGHTLLRIATTTDNVRLPGGTVVETASRATIFAEMIRSMARDGPLATAASFAAVIVVVLIATRNIRGALGVLSVLLMGVLWTAGGAAWTDLRVNFLNFIAFPITFGIGCEYPFNVYDRSRLLRGDVSSAVKRTGGAVALCSYTTVVGYSAMLFADNQALQSFGHLAVSGEIACIVGALLVLPALLHVMSRGGKTYAAETRDTPPPPAPPVPSAPKKVGPAKDEVVPSPGERPVDLAP